MASIKQMETKDGKRFFQICVSRGHGKAPYKKRWYWPDGWSRRTAEREAAKVAAEFERACGAGEVMNRAQEKEKAAQEAAEAAKLKTVRQYVDGVYMPAKETTLSENGRSSYRMFLDKHILPVLGNMLLVDVSAAVLTKLLVDFQRRGYAHASAVKLYNIMNGVFTMAFLDDSIPNNPMLKVKRPAPRKDEKVQEEGDKAFTVQELSRVLSCVLQEPLKWQAYINLAADSGRVVVGYAASNGQMWTGTRGQSPSGAISNTPRLPVCMRPHPKTAKRARLTSAKKLLPCS